jgi:hypothetical protein
MRKLDRQKGELKAWFVADFIPENAIDFMMKGLIPIA